MSLRIASIVGKRDILRDSAPTIKRASIGKEVRALAAARCDTPSRIVQSGTLQRARQVYSKTIKSFDNFLTYQYEFYFIQKNIVNLAKLKLR